MFKKSAVFRHPHRVFNVVPGDFTQHGKLDLLVMSQGQALNQLAIDLYVSSVQGGFGEEHIESTVSGLSNNSIDASPISAPPSTLAQPIPMDWNGDLKIDLLGISSPSSSASPFRIWQNVWNASQSDSPIFNLYAMQLSWVSHIL